MLNENDRKFLRMAYDEAKAGFDEGGCPIGSVLARGDVLVSRGPRPYRRDLPVFMHQPSRRRTFMPWQRFFWTMPGI
jgi:tRNA(Arg) A34 adenosine deaminase TadA